MPEMDGFAFCSTVKSDDQLRTIPFIFYTATYVEAKDEKLALALGASRFIVKPIEMEEFLKVIEEVFTEYKEKRLPVPKRLKKEKQEKQELEGMYKEALTRKLDKKVRELQMERTALRESEEHIRLLLMSTGEAIYGIDLQGDCTFANPACLRMLGYRDDQDLLGKNMHALIHHTRPDGSSYPEEECRIYQAFRESKGTHVDDEVLWRQDGTRFPAEYWSYPIYKDDQVVGSVVTFLDITERKEGEEKIQHMAYYDLLTDLPNRTLFQENLQRAILMVREENKSLALLLMDLDHFREINDTLGHHRGDILLKQVGSRLQNTVYHKDIVSRLGGDEFAVLLPLAESEHASLVARKIMSALDPPFLVEGLPIAVEASIGIALYPDHSTDAEGLIQRVDVAMYVAKHMKKGITIYDPAQDKHNPQKLALMAELRYAIEHEELVLYYQPKINIKANRVMGVEALVRWQHPHRGLIPPYEFIELAERTGLIKPLTLWVFNTAHRQCEALRQKGIEISISINLSTRNLQDPELSNHIGEKVKGCDLAGSPLELEITESAIMDDPKRALENIRRLKGLGAKFSIDDFGTGYSSLGYLKSLPVDAIKIDRSFVKDMVSDENDAAIVRSIIGLAHDLDLWVIAEGVENKKTYNQLAAMGCDAAQGYYMCRPIPSAELSRWLHESPWGLKRS